MSVDAASIGALGVVATEWLALGWLSGLRVPAPALVEPPGTAERWPARAAALAVRLLVGAWLVALAQLLLALVGIGFGFVPGALLLAAAIAIATRQLLRLVRAPQCGDDKPLAERSGSSSPDGWRRERIGWLLLGAVLVAALVHSLVVPESGWDAFSHWGLRALAFADAGTVVNARSEHEYYPPLVPLLEAWLYLHRGQVSIDLGKTVWALIGGAFAVCLGWQLRLALRPSASWLAPFAATGIILVTPELLDGFWTGQADLPLTVYLCLATLAVWQWQPGADGRWLVLAAVFGAAAALTKFEGLPRIGLLCLALLAEAALVGGIRRAWPPLLSLALPAVATWLVWTAFQLTHAIPANAEHVGAFQPLATGGVLVALGGVFSGVRTGGGALVTLASWAVAGSRLLKPPLRLLVLVVAVQAVGTLVAFLLSSTSPELEVLTSATRLVEQFLPIALLVGLIGLVRVSHL